MHKETVCSFVKREYASTPWQNYICPAGVFPGFNAAAMYGQPEKLHLCVLPNGIIVYAGIIGKEGNKEYFPANDSLLVVSEEEYNSHMKSVRDEMIQELSSATGYNADDIYNNDNLYDHQIEEPARERIASTYYWIKKS